MDLTSNRQLVAATASFSRPCCRARTRRGTSSFSRRGLPGCARVCAAPGSTQPSSHVVGPDRPPYSGLRPRARAARGADHGKRARLLPCLPAEPVPPRAAATEAVRSSRARLLRSCKFRPVLVPPIGAVIIASLGWQYIFYFCAIPGLLFSVAWYFLVANDPAQSRFTSASEVEHIRSAPPAATLGKGQEAKPADKRGKGKLRWLDRLIRARSVRPFAKAAEIFASANVWGLALACILMTGIINVILAWLPALSRP